MQSVELGSDGSAAPRLESFREKWGSILSEVLSLGIEGKLLEFHRRYRIGALQDVGRDIND